MKITFDKNFEKELQRELNADIKKALKAVILEIEVAPTLRNITNLKKLKGYKTFYRIKFGTYRIGVDIVNDTVCFITYGHRKDFYRYFPR